MAELSMEAAEKIAVPASTRQSSRLYFVDHLRAALVILVVLHHLALVYGGVPPFYYIEPPFTDPQAGLMGLIFVLFNQAWFMGAFFLLAGYFTPGTVNRKGPAAFVKERLLRLGIPILVFMFILSPLASVGYYLMPATLTGITTPLSWEVYWEAYPRLIGLGPLWFVTMLLVFSFGYVLWRRVRGDRPAPQPTATQPSYLAIGIFVLALAGASFLLRMVVPLGQEVNIFTSALSFPTIAYLPQYLGFFVVGLYAARHDWFRTLSSSMGIAGFMMALVAAVVLFPLAFSGEWFSLETTEAIINNAFGHGHWQSAVYALWDSAFAVGLVLALIPLFRWGLNVPGRLGTFLSRHSYTVYIIHVPIIVYVAYLLRDIAQPALVKFGLATLLVLPICFSLAYVLRRIPGTRHVL